MRDLHGLAHRDERWYGDEEMYVILGDRSFDDFHVVRLAELPYQIPDSLRYLTVEDLRTILRAPYHRVLEVVDCVRSFPVVLHTGMILKSSP